MNGWLKDSDYQVSTHSAETMSDFVKLIEKQEIDYALLDGSNFIQYYNQLKPSLMGETWMVQRSDKAYEEYMYCLPEREVMQLI